MKEDKSTIELENLMAKLSGKEAALFCVSGSMSNQLGLRTLLQGPLESALVDSRSHVYKYENGGVSFHSQAMMTPMRPLVGNSCLTASQISTRFIRPDIHCAKTRVICLENTLNGSIFPLDEIKKISEFAKLNDILMHLDGARLWNASAATGIPISKYAENFDSLSLCLSKGIGAPIGSVLLGDDKFIAKARHFRKLFGGGWRQSGMLAEAAKHALEITFFNTDNNSKSLIELDNENAKWLSNEIETRFSGKLKVVNTVETNIIFLDVRGVIPGKISKVKNVVETIHDMNLCDLENECMETPSKLLLPTFGYSYDQGDGDFSDEEYIMRLVIHHQTPRKACGLLLDYFERFCLNSQ